ncbi:hypothetical protein DNTS_005290 [Danionella cerebrum]|uniref:Beta-catenin-like protein 1 n=1 Tax=Danionella cerebrum TaxID=2873325 RepID=A0A553R8Y9_9TELE|nr:hypothetical protein DNTS_005290 [Danionella translucida]
MDPDRGAKRPRDESSSNESRSKQRLRDPGRLLSRTDAEDEDLTTADGEKILERLMDQDGEDPEGEPVDEAMVKKMILNFEKRSYKNQELRIKFPDNPEKFMEAELDLNDIIQEMHVIATIPELYHLLVELNAVHIAVVDLLQELSDIDTLHESEEGAAVLIDALLEGQVVALMVQNMERLDESAKMPFDGNKLYCSEILAILLQNNDKTRELLGELDGIDVLLQQLSVFKRHNPSTAEEQEMMENLFDALCSCLMLPANRDRFLKGEGLQLMNLMLREKKISRVSALKVLDYGMIGPEGSDNCHKFVDILGLRTIFPLFMKTPKKMKKAGVSDKEHEEHVCSIIASMLRNLRGQQRSRLLSKFTENDYEKVDRLMELHFKYLEAVQLATRRIEGEKHEMVRRGEILDDAMDEEFYLRRLDAGLFVHQLICYVMVEICAAGIQPLQQRVHQILNLRGGSVKVVQHILREYAENIGDGKSEEFKESEQKRIMELLENF